MTADEDFWLRSNLTPVMAAVKQEQEEVSRRPVSAAPSSASTEDSMEDDIKKGAWTAEEDVQLAKLVKVPQTELHS